MDEYNKRKQAIDRYHAGEKITSIIRSFGKSRQWFYNWLDRYKASGGRGEWFVEHSRAPKSTPSKIVASIEQQVIRVRKYLEAKRMAQTGAIAIQYELRNQGFDPPAVWTINRIISRNGLNRSKPAVKTPKDYPEGFIHTHLMDLVGPRFLKGDGRFYSVNIIDASTRVCSVQPVRTKSSAGIAKALADFWHTHGMPDALQMDNELAFRGSNRYPRSFGTVVRFALALGIAPVFIPVGEPWRNGIIERFNNTYDKRFFKAQTFESFDHLQRASKEFSAYHNAKHRYSTMNQKTPDEAAKELLFASYYDNSINLDERIPLEEGNIYLIRFIRSDLMLHLPTESFKVDASLKYSYVVAQISVENHCLLVLQNNQVIQRFAYAMPLDR